jgi:hypothetical protein
MVTLNLIPEPRIVKTGRGTFELKEPCPIALEEGIGDALPGELLAACLRETSGIEASVVTGTSAQDLAPRNIVFGHARDGTLTDRILRENSVDLKPDLDREGYIVHVNSDGVVVAAGTETGLFYGAQTLVQLIRSSPSALPALTIWDWPLMDIRGVSDDISRGQVSTLDNFKKIVRVLASYKINVYMPYIEDMFVFDKHPLVGKGRGALTKEEVAELDSYARRYHVEVIPIFESLGHQERMLALPEYNGYAEVPDKPWSLSPAKEESYELLDELYSEICPAFSSEYFHIGCDESIDIGKGASKELVERMGAARVHAEHYKKVYDMITRHGKKALMYGDMCLEHPEILGDMPRDITIVDWHYDPDTEYPSIEKFQSPGFRVLVSPGTQAWSRLFPHYGDAAVNIENLIKRGYERGVWGEVTSTWGDNGAENLRELNYYGFAFSADCAWSPDKATYKSFNKRFFPEFYGTDSPDLRDAFENLVRINTIFPKNFFMMWEEPFHEKPDVEMVKKAHKLAKLTDETLRKLENAEKHVERNADNVAYLRLAARRGGWLARKILCEAAVAELEGMEQPDRESVDRCISECNAAADELEEIKEEFRKLWLLTNKEPGLKPNLDRYDEQVEHFRAKAHAIVSDCAHHAK